MMKQKHKRPTSIKDGIAPTKERRRQNGGVFAEIINKDPKGNALLKRYRAVWECPLDAYKDIGIINAAQHKAGLEFRKAYYASVVCKTVNDRMSEEQLNREVSKLERVLRAAFKELSPTHTESVIDACGHNLLVTDAVKLERLKIGLGKLTKLWNLTAQEVCNKAP